MERKVNLGDNAQEGRWCSTPHGSPVSGTVQTNIQASLLGAVAMGDRTYPDVLKLQVIDSAGRGDPWYYAKGYGFIYFTDGTITQGASSVVNYPVTVRVPCSPRPACM